MTKSHIILGAAACSGLAWRVHDPIGSYTTLFEAARRPLQTVSASELAAKSISLLLVDQINGILIGLILASIIHLVVWVLKKLMTAIWNRMVSLLFRLRISRLFGSPNSQPTEPSTESQAKLASV